MATMSTAGATTRATDVVVQMESVNFHYGNWHALKDINMEVRTGGVLGLLGHNGAGKTTTIRLLNGLLRPSGGSITVLGVDPIAGGAPFRRQTSVVNDSLGLHERQTARQTMAFHAELFAVDATSAAAEAEELLIRFGLGTVIDTPVKAYSRGMRQRLALARSLLHRPRLLLLDEPTLGMDPVGRSEFRAILRALTADGVSIVMSTHDLGEVEKACDDLLILHHGEVLLSGNRHSTMARVARNIEVTIELSDGSTEHFVAVDRQAIADRVRALVLSGADVISVRPETATLEDLYIDIHGTERR